jgi:hypothetical protein
MQYLHHHGIFAFTTKHKNIFKIFHSLPIYHEIHVFKKKFTLQYDLTYVKMNIMQNLITLMVKGFRV